MQVILRLPHVALAQVASEFEDKGAHGILNQTIGGLRRDNDDLTEVDRNEELLAVNVELVGVIGRTTAPARLFWIRAVCPDSRLLPVGAVALGPAAELFHR